MDPLTFILIICTVGLVSNLFRVLRRKQPSENEVIREDDIKIRNSPKGKAVVPILHE